MASFGLTSDGFLIKSFDAILSDSLDRARQMFGNDVDLTATSPLRKILEVAAQADAELWKRMEDLYYSNFISTAIGDNLDLLGEDIGVPRRQLFAQGQVTFTLSNAVPGRQYTLPEGVLLRSASGLSFYTTAVATLNSTTTTATVGAQAFDRGPQDNVAASQVQIIDSTYQQLYLNLGSATLAVTNSQPFSGGEANETDDDYRARLLGWPRNMWTLESIQQAALDVDGVIDVLLFDPLGGVDVSQSYFNFFRFNERLFNGDRLIGEPYFFEVVVAHEFAWPWRTTGAVSGVYERVKAAIDLVRPIGIYPNIVQADHIEVAARARIIADPGYDQQALLASVRDSIAADVSALKLGSDVLYSQVMRAIVEQPGVSDVQNLHLRRCPPAFGRITFGPVPFQQALVEAAEGENLVMGPTEIAIFRQDSGLNDLQVVPR